ncbi:TIGR02234 family membrane protein [Corynebacterium comes]|uniref:Tryptophan-associated transmembrane protein n=1 Tax=Corynebacterium comes TaxID=2675218 RepID=A0A6B8VXR8_9CORY|nr:TIGR02234 family membrane protein [Corynebacterium comes]QGU04951.1 Tryptophan-associated transmembrane protein [Corynebacterium comes]
MKQSRIAALLLALSAAVLWGASRMTWITVGTFDDKSGDATNAIIGGLWSTEQTAVAMLLLAGSIAGFALRRVGRRVVGIISALAGIGASWAPLGLLTGEPDPRRVHQLLSTGDEAKISAWAEIANLSVNNAGPALAMLGAAVALFGGVLLAVRPGTDSAALNRYERKQDREAKISRDLVAEPDSGRVMWDALDADIDPTDANRP